MRDRRAITLSVLSVWVLVASAQAATIRVPEDYASVAAAVKWAADGDTVLVSSRHDGGADVYTDEAIRISGKRVTLWRSGSESITIKGTRSSETIAVAAGGELELGKGFEIVNPGSHPALLVSDAHVDASGSFNSGGTAIELRSRGSLDGKGLWIQGGDVALRVGDESMVSIHGDSWPAGYVSAPVCLVVSGARSRARLSQCEFGCGTTSAEVSQDAHLEIRDAFLREPVELSDDATAELRNIMWYPYNATTDAGADRAVDVRDHSAVVISNNTFSSQQRDYAVFIRHDARAEIRDSVFKRVQGTAVYCNWGTQITLSHNAVWENGTDFVGCPSDPAVFTSDPLLTGTYVLSEDSPLIDAGSDLASAVFPESGYSALESRDSDTGRVDLGFHYWY